MRQVVEEPHGGLVLAELERQNWGNEVDEFVLSGTERARFATIYNDALDQFNANPSLIGVFTSVYDLPIIQAS